MPVACFPAVGESLGLRTHPVGVWTKFKSSEAPSNPWVYLYKFKFPFIGEFRYTS